MNDINVITEHIQKYGKLRTKSGALIGTQLANRKGDIARNNYSIAARLLVDKNAHLSRAPVDFEEREFYGQVLYYFVHEFNNELSMLALVQWVRDPERLANHILFFRYLGETNVINVWKDHAPKLRPYCQPFSYYTYYTTSSPQKQRYHHLDRCVGFLKVATNKHIIIDRENRVTFR
ncbi:hypothetical protein RhiirC2_794878 [Rhizophagus irregularis]|uniref:Uncharacterized protein n=1 Tax=Rhizophagus irregularis TaxID=588596 RepID=A0A2N1MCN3_9GLOM|nr:hypothetical protein RhiirC2_794878 [Rhizophagus irregularis]